ncbi:MAG: right-handed parallel beta-helix repeat-containing protein, partial [Candidatus Hodarchaeota archaeon]
MKSHVYVCMLMIFFGLSLGCFIPITLKSPDFNPLSVSTSSLKDSIIKGSQLGYTSSPPISITANSDFQSYASQGNGTKISPYVIQGLNITNTSTADNLIDITNTDAYFQIKNCFLKGGNRGISLEGVTNGEIANNFISNNTQSAIAVLFSSDNNTISSNTIINTEDGISISSCENNLINNNTVINTDGVGIHIYSNSQNNTLSNNYAQDNILDGIRLTSSSKNKLINNTLDDNYGAGINLFSSSDHNILLNNTALNNNGRGIYI